MGRKKLILILFLTFFTGVLKPVLSQDIYIEKSGGSEAESGVVVIPFAFYLKTLGLAGAVDVAFRGFLQDQTVGNLVFLMSTNKSRYLYGEFFHLNPPGLDRLFLDMTLDWAKYGALDLYSGIHPLFPGEVAGSNSSHRDNFFQIESSSFATELLGRFILPIGFGRETVINTLFLEDGIPVNSSRKGEGSIFHSGRTSLNFSLFYRNQTLELPNLDRKIVSAGMTVGLQVDDLDFKDNPTRQNTISLKYFHGSEHLESTVPWGMVEGIYNHYFPIESSWARQQVIAFSLWNRYVTSWYDYTEKGDSREYHRPTPFMGASLGGMYRFRGYPEARFSDRSAWLYTLEYRMIPHWNPLGDSRFMDRINVRTDWLQFVLFAEAGRVAPEWDLETFHRDMKFDGGFGVRVFANQMVVRVDAGFSNEGMQLQMFVNQAF